MLCFARVGEAEIHSQPPKKPKPREIAGALEELPECLRDFDDLWCVGRRSDCCSCGGLVG
jgi:hypothetical protein